MIGQINRDGSVIIRPMPRGAGELRFLKKHIGKSVIQSLHIINENSQQLKELAKGSPLVAAEIIKQYPKYNINDIP